MIVTFVVNSLWQGLIALGITTLVLRLISPRDAATRYAAWFLTLAAAIVIPALTVFTHFGSQLLGALQHGAASKGAAYSFVFAGTLTGETTRWLTLPAAAASPLFERTAAALWIGGATIGLARLAISLFRIGRLVAGATLHSTIEGVPVLSSPDLAIPIATGFSSPAILVPAELTAALGPKDLQATIEHELAHVLRGDVVANAIQRLFEAIFFWNPWIQLAGRRISNEREAACDDRAVLRMGETREYALCLATLGRRIAEKSAPLLTPGAFGSRNALVARIERLMGDGSPASSHVNYLALGGVLMLFAALTLAFQALVPAAAQAAPLPAPTNAIVAATCANPNAEAGVVNPAAPKVPMKITQATSAEVAVTIAPNGNVVNTRIYKSSGNAAIDKSVLAAAEKSTYSPKIVNCVATQGSYLFMAQFAP